MSAPCARRLVLAPIALVLSIMAGCTTHARPALSAASEPTPPRSSPDGTRLELAIRAHLQFLASDALNGRGSGTRDEWIAATYIAACLSRLGLEPMGDDGGFVQKVEIQPFTVGAPPVLAIGDRRWTHGEGILVRATGGAVVSGPLRRLVEGQPVAPGSAVLVPETFAPERLPDLSRAALVLRHETAAQRESWAPTGRQLPRATADILGLPAPRVLAATTVVLNASSYAAFHHIADGETVTLRTALTAAPRTATWNAVGRLRGSDPTGVSEAIVLSAHLDHEGARATPDGSTTADVIYNGADDDASGVAAVLELARALVEGGAPRRTVVFAFFGSEEAGGYGSRYFADRPVVPLTDIVANLQVEMIGRPDSLVPAGTLWLTGFERSSLGPWLAGRGAPLVKDPHPAQRFFERSDNIQFARRGVVAHTISSYGLHREYHQPSDEVRHINTAHMRDAIIALIGPVRALADSLDRPAWLPGLQP